MLHKNCISDTGAAAVAAALEKNGTLQRIRRGSNTIGDAGVRWPSRRKPPWNEGRRSAASRHKAVQRALGCHVAESHMLIVEFNLINI